MKKWLVLDFDGVINQCGAFLNQKPTWGDERSTVACFKPVTYSPALIMLLKDLDNAGVSIVWLSTLHHRTTIIGGALGLPTLPYIPEAATTGDGWWKISSFKKFLLDQVNVGDRIVWVDDDLPGYSQDDEASVDELRMPTLSLVSPDATKGLSPNEFLKVLKHLEVSLPRDLVDSTA